ncbi:ubiquitin-like modifier-activating enzyme atg7 [Basidiobolus meristosporus CBS 931.73]|uniref:Ubiquitin-like modifier-activating enzyme ATG7 n=1 Tax=Basidiobolus meristosporus CBS 931.73 TaxID=1314790 RepID=A0A1Y1Y5V6_9FUNG|nr:ubiquitin-like modifier-activating enzyme atg7 [Basidiobolus meristosporus CBS 931.73]|eukprot:ORX93410.1 ubiquitin-like modifier-activating enzyme atg7 [Basidiobolus meristosporus CBS 931.73]
MSKEQTILQFEPFCSAIEAPFWHTLTQLKIEEFKLDDEIKDITGYYQMLGGVSFTGKEGALPSRLCLGNFSYEEGTEDLPPFSICAPGFIKNTNTIEEFKQLNKSQTLAECAKRVLEDIESGAALNTPHLLARFILLTFANLKNYKYYYWFGCPALTTNPTYSLRDISGLSSIFDDNQICEIQCKYQDYRGARPQEQHGFFVLNQTGAEIEILTLQEAKNLQASQLIFGFADPSSLPSNPGWPLRNYLALIRQTFSVNEARILCYREIIGKKDISPSKLLRVDLDVQLNVDENNHPKSTGWERNAQGKLGPRVADLAPLMDPHKLANTAVDLNLKLMRWRLLPSLNLEKIASQKCLLLGSGTLGCYVARSLLGWGVRHITFVDNSRVSFSNPARQPLFNFEDSLGGGKEKAKCAADNLKKVFPGVVSEGHTISIPMPGHPVVDAEKSKSEVEKIANLISTHDVIFLLMDSRESRWLPTLLGAHFKKLVVNAALGFDTYMVMRHGVPAYGDPAEAKPDGMQLGCYFCNDIVAPTDSLSNRTLDQQCTVTRPGLSAIASATAVELLVSVLQHEDGALAPADNSRSISESTTTPLGLVPHQIRGFLSHFSQMLVVGRAYDKCTACSKIVLDAYADRGFEFLKQAFDSSDYLEEITGLTQLHAESELADWDSEIDDEDISII